VQVLWVVDPSYLQFGVTVTCVDQYAGPVGGGSLLPAVWCDSDMCGPVCRSCGWWGSLPPAGHDPADGCDDGDEEQHSAEAHHQRNQRHSPSLLHVFCLNFIANNYALFYSYLWMYPNLTFIIIKIMVSTATNFLYMKYPSTLRLLSPKQDDLLWPNLFTV
jgi:hypothetical protein